MNQIDNRLDARAYGTDKTPAQPNPLPGAINALGYSIGELDGRLMDLRSRLSAVLTPTPPVPASQEKQQLTAAAPPIADMTAEVAQQSRRVDSLAMLVNDLLNRLEV
jgi:hypothetical protein